MRAPLPRRAQKRVAVAAAAALILTALTLKPLQAAQLRFGLSSAGLGYPFAAAIAKGFQTAATRAGVNAIVLDAQGRVQKQADDVDDLIGQKINGIALMPLDSVVAQSWVDRAAAAGIAVVAVGSQIGEIDRAEQAIERLHIKAASVDVPVRDLSGGNAQKVSIAKWLTGATRRLLLDEPTVGVDIGAKTEIVHSIRCLAEAGGSVVMVSSEFEELLAACDRILVMRAGAVVAERQSNETGEHELILLAGGTAALGPPCSDTADTIVTAPTEVSHIWKAVPPQPESTSATDAACERAMRAPQARISRPPGASDH